jgi:two-component system alkaline phosphatase synthesis response regulator PhoP
MMVSSTHDTSHSRGHVPTHKKILIVEDDPGIVDYVSIYCRAEGYVVIQAPDGLEALEKFKETQPDFVLLDLMLPRMDGLEVCRRIRKDSDVPIIMVTARAEEVDKLLGLETGADDYLTKPFSPRELMARIRVIFRRLEKSERNSLPATTHKNINLGTLDINIDTREVHYEHNVINTLTNKEFELLLTLARQPGRVYSKTELEEALYDCDSLVASRAIGVHISNLRAKLPNPRLIETVHGVGYKLSREAI